MYLSEEDFFEDYFDGFPLEATDENIETVRGFLLQKWQERHVKNGGDPAALPTDLSDSCKFTALFGSVAFGADIAGNYDHVYNLLDGRIIDINAGAADVIALGNPYRHDERFIESDDFRDSVESCVRRVSGWIEEFRGAMADTPKAL